MIDYEILVASQHQFVAYVLSVIVYLLLLFVSLVGYILSILKRPVLLEERKTLRKAYLPGNCLLRHHKVPH